MIDRMNMNERVGGIMIRMNESSPINREMIKVINTRYHNLYSLYLHDYSEQINDEIYQELMVLLEQKNISLFVMQFYDSLKSSE